VTCCRDIPEYHDPACSRGAPLSLGDTLDDRFVIDEVLSRTRIATVFKARDLRNENRVVAIKMPSEEASQTTEVTSQYQREEAFGLELNHPFVLKYVKVSGKKSRVYVVTEYLRGCTLEHLLRAMRPLPEHDALKIMSLICDALQYLHRRGIIHRDLKPQNIMLCCDGTIRILDLGISRRLEPRHAESTGFLGATGTPDYIAPEQVTGNRCDIRTDIYTAGAVLYELLTGVPPFTSENAWVATLARVSADPQAPRRLNPKLSTEAEEIVLRALQRNPQCRFQSASEFKAALDNPTQVPITGLCDRLQTRKGSPRWVISLKDALKNLAGRIVKPSKQTACEAVPEAREAA